MQVEQEPDFQAEAEDISPVELHEVPEQEATTATQELDSEAPGCADDELEESMFWPKKLEELPPAILSIAVLEDRHACLCLRSSCT